MIRLMILIIIAHLLNMDWEDALMRHLKKYEINILLEKKGKSLVKKFDGEFPDIYFDEVMDYLEIKKRFF